MTRFLVATTRARPTHSPAPRSCRRRCPKKLRRCGEQPAAADRLPFQRADTTGRPSPAAVMWQTAAKRARRERIDNCSRPAAAVVLSISSRSELLRSSCPPPPVIPMGYSAAKHTRFRTAYNLASTCGGVLGFCGEWQQIEFGRR